MTDFGKIIEPRRVKIEAPRKRHRDLTNRDRKQMINILLAGDVIICMILMLMRSFGKVHVFALIGIVLTAYIAMLNNRK